MTTAWFFPALWTFLTPCPNPLSRFLAWEDDVDISFMLEDSIDWDTFVSEVTLKLAQQEFNVIGRGVEPLLCRLLFNKSPYRIR